MSKAAPLTTPARSPSKRELTAYPPPPKGKCSMIFVYAAEMMRTVSPVASARKTPRYWCSPRFLNASSGPYADELSPSAPRPTQARNAASEMCWKSSGSWMSFGPPSSARLRRCHCVGSRGGSGSWSGGGALLGADPGAEESMAEAEVVARTFVRARAPGRRGHFINDFAALRPSRRQSSTPTPRYQAPASSSPGCAAVRRSISAIRAPCPGSYCGIASLRRADRHQAGLERRGRAARERIDQLLHAARERGEARARFLSAAPSECAADETSLSVGGERVQRRKGGAQLEPVGISGVDPGLDRVPEKPAAGSQAVREKLGDAAPLRRRTAERLAEKGELLAPRQQARAQRLSETARQRIDGAVPLEEPERRSSAGGAGRDSERGGKPRELARSVEDSERRPLHQEPATRVGPQLAARAVLGIDEERLDAVFAQRQRGTQPCGARSDHDHGVRHQVALASAARTSRASARA